MPKPSAASSHDPRVDAYIAKAAAFAQPILQSVRAAMWEAAPDAEETIKWARPFYVLDGVGGPVILGHISAFKAHCAVGLWGAEAAQMLGKEGLLGKGAMGSFGRLTGVADLPPHAEFVRLIRYAASVIEQGRRTKSIDRPRAAQRVAKAELPIPAELAAAFAEHAQARAAFEAFPPGCRREYLQWIGDAKREETRARRVGQTVERLLAGKRMDEECTAKR